MAAIQGHCPGAASSPPTIRASLPATPHDLRGIGAAVVSALDGGITIVDAGSGCGGGSGGGTDTAGGGGGLGGATGGGLGAGGGLGLGLWGLLTTAVGIAGFAVVLGLLLGFALREGFVLIFLVVVDDGFRVVLVAGSLTGRVEAAVEVDEALEACIVMEPRGWCKSSSSKWSSREIGE